MTAIDFLNLFTPFDIFALAVFVFTWVATGWRIEHPDERRPSVSTLMAEYRREWLRKMAERNPRIFDAQILSTLRANTSFFASSTMIALGGVAALIGNSDELRGIATDLGGANFAAAIWEVKLILVGFFLLNAFLKFVWANRLFGYCGVLMGAIPNAITDEHAIPRAAKAAEINILAARSFNRGLRAIYFALAATGWFLGPAGLLAAAAIVCAVLWRREFASRSREVLMGHEDGAFPPAVERARQKLAAKKARKEEEIEEIVPIEPIDLPDDEDVPRDAYWDDPDSGKKGKEPSVPGTGTDETGKDG